MSGYDVLVAGEYYCDLIFGGVDAPPRLSQEVVAERLSIRPGGGYTMALGLSRLGVRTAWACDFGNDFFSRLVLEQAHADGIDPVAFRQLGRSGQMVSAAFADETERGFITFRELPVVPPAEHILSTLDPQWLLQTFRFTPQWLAFIRAARARGIRIFGDCSGESASIETPGVLEFIGLCDVFSPNESEALALTRSGSLDEAISQLAEVAPAIVVKRGSAGASAVFRGVRYDSPAPAVAVVDTVGAGDAFAAGFLSASIHGASIDDQLRAAVACGSLSTTAAGNSASPTTQELTAFLATTRHDRRNSHSHVMSTNGDQL